MHLLIASQDPGRAILKSRRWYLPKVLGEKKTATLTSLLLYIHCGLSIVAESSRAKSIWHFQRFMHCSLDFWFLSTPQGRSLASGIRCPTPIKNLLSTPQNLRSGDSSTRLLPLWYSPIFHFRYTATSHEDIGGPVGCPHQL